MSDAQPSAELQDQAQEPKPLGPFARHIRIAYSIYMLFAVGLIIMGVITFSFLYAILIGAITPGEEAGQIGTMIDFANLVVLVLYFIALLWCIVMTCRWTFRAMKNLQLTGRDDSISPGWAVGWYFIPFANLWMPFKAMQEIWRGSQNAGSEGRGKIPASMGWWWFLWVVGGVVSNIASRISGGLDPNVSLERLVWGSGIDVVSTCMFLGSAFLLLGIITKISKAQDEDVLGPLRQIFA